MKEKMRERVVDYAHRMNVLVENGTAKRGQTSEYLLGGEAMNLTEGSTYPYRADISAMFGGDVNKGIAKPAVREDVILLFANEDEVYLDYFYPKKTHDFCLFTGIGRRGNQDSPEDNKDCYSLNIAVLDHQRTKRSLLLFEKASGQYVFRGEYALTGTSQNIQPDENDELRRVFLFHLKRIRKDIEILTNSELANL